MKRESFTCPTCGHIHHKPLPTVARSVSWSEACACSDYSPCLHHQVAPENMPMRPSNAELMDRARAETAKRDEAWVKWRERMGPT